MRCVLSLLLLLLVLLPSTMAEETANLLANPSFELLDADGMPLNWRTDAYLNVEGLTLYGVAEEAHAGERCAEIVNLDYNDARFYQTVAVEPNTAYRLSGYVKAWDTLDEGRGANLSIKDVYVFSESIYESADEWVYVEVYGLTGEDQREVTVYARLGGYSGESIGTARLDDLCLEKVDVVPDGVYLHPWAKRTTNAVTPVEDTLTAASPAWSWLLVVAALYVLAAAAVLKMLDKQSGQATIKKTGEQKRKASVFVIAGVAVAALVRLVVSLNVTGYQVDINCFLSWGNTMLAHGPANFYQTTSFCDYPPAYVYVMGLNALLSGLLSFVPSAVVYKLLPMACDLVAAALVYRLARRKQMEEKHARLLFLLMAFNPAMLLNSAAWGQVDSVLSLLLVLVAYFAISGQWTLVMPVYMLAVLVKPQALMMGFLGLAAIVMALIKDKNCWKDMLRGVGVALVVALLVVVPFSIKQGGLTWLFELYGSTLSSYAYATVNTANLYYLFNCNWRAIVYAAPVVIPVTMMLLTALWTAHLVKHQRPEKRHWPLAMLVLCGIVAGFALVGAIATPSDWTRQMVFRLGFTVTVSRLTLLVLGVVALAGAAAALGMVLRQKQFSWDMLETAISATFVLIFGGLCLFNASFTMVGTVAMAYAFLLVLPMFIRAGKLEHLPLCGAVLFVLLFVFGIKMHERYLFPALFLLGLAYLYKPDKRILAILVGMSAILFLNEGIVLDNSIRLGASQGHLNNDTKFLAQVMSLGNVLLALLSVVTCRQICMGVEAPAKSSKAAAPSSKKAKGTEILTEKPADPLKFRPDSSLHWKKRDWVLMLGLTAIYAVVALTNLGSLKAPQNPWKSTTRSEQVVIDLGAQYADVSMLYYCQVSYSDFSVAVSDDGENWSEEYWAQMAEGQCFQWKYLVTSYESNGQRIYNSSRYLENVQKLSGRYVRITSQQIGLILNEVIFRDAAGETILAKVILQDYYRSESPLFSSAENLLDEQDTLEGQPSWWNGTYFDEIYHARTAYEHLNGTVPYETSHPPLGKVIMSWGVAMFGMTPFGWRFMGAVMGILMLPAMYLLGKQLTKKSTFAFAAMVMLALDCQHFTQTRIATIDSYPVLFILLSWLFMIRFIQKDIVRLPLKKLLPELALSGLFMGCGIASKWIGIYSGAGLALVFFWTLFRHMRMATLSAQRLHRDKKLTEEQKQELTLRDQATMKRLLVICLWCLLFFVLIPLVIYLLSYIPYFAYAKYDNLKDYLVAVWKAQTGMFSYHSEPGRGMDHPFYSPWYEWPLNKRPMYYASPSYITTPGYSYAIWCFGNPAVWCAGLVGIAYVLYRYGKRHYYALPGQDAQLHLDASDNVVTMPVLIVATLAQFLPWVLVPRGTYIYHYFATTPFLMLSVSVMLHELSRRYPKVGKIILWAFLFVCLVMFIAYFPYASGVLTPTSWLDFMKQFLRIYY